MTAGFNLKGNIWRLNTAGRDDSVGGAVPSGTVVYAGVLSRISPAKPTLALLEQGLETPELYSALFGFPCFGSTGSFDVLHNDQYEITWPPISSFYGKKFVFISIQHQSYEDGRRYLKCVLRRMETANSNNLQ